MRTSSRSASVIAAATTSLLAPMAAVASSLPTSYSIHMYSGVTAMPNSSSASAGVVQIPDNDWYNENAAASAVLTTTTTNSETEVNGSDASPTIVASYGFNNGGTASSQENFGVGDPSDSDLYSGYFGSNGGNGITISFSSIPSTFTSAGYDVYFYFATNNTATTTVTDGNGVTFATHGNSQDLLNAFVEATPGSTATTAGDYVEFSESNPSVTFTFTQSNPGGLWVSGIQIVEVPEPATVTLVSLGSAAALLRRRRRAPD